MASRRRHGDRLSPVEAADQLYRNVRPIALQEITIDPSIQVRVDGLNEARIEQYVELLLAGEPFKDPIVLFQDGEKLLLAAGFHRCEAYDRARSVADQADQADAIPPLLAEIRSGGRAAAIEFAEEDNLTHGLELSTADKRHIFERRLARGHAWIQLSNRALAARLGVSHTTVRRWREEISDSTGTNIPVEGSKRIGADGKVRDVSGIQAANRQRADTPEPSPADSPGWLDDTPDDAEPDGLANLHAALNNLCEALTRATHAVQPVWHGARFGHTAALKTLDWSLVRDAIEFSEGYDNPDGRSWGVLEMLRELQEIYGKGEDAGDGC